LFASVMSLSISSIAFTTTADTADAGAGSISYPADIVLQRRRMGWRPAGAKMLLS